MYDLSTYLGSYPRLNLGVGSMFQTVHQKPTTFPFRLLKYINLIISYLCGNNASQRLCRVSVICGKYTHPSAPERVIVKHCHLIVLQDCCTIRQYFVTLPPEKEYNRVIFTTSQRCITAKAH